MTAAGRRAALRATLLALGVLGLAQPAAAQGKRGGAVLPGGDSKEPINIEATKLDYFDKEQKLIYTGGVVATQGASKLKASVLTIFLAPRKAADGKGGGAGGGTSTNQVQHMVAAGPVTMVQRDQVGTGDAAVYDKSANTVVMTGNVTLSQGPNVTKGEKLTYDLRTGQAVVSGRVKSMFLPGSDAGTAPGRERDTATADADGEGRARAARRPSR